jgi:hypothetical protein
MFLLFILMLLFQDQILLKSSKEFDIITNYELRKKPEGEPNRIVFDRPEEQRKSSGTDLLPYLTLKLKIKKWGNEVTQIKITDSQGKMYLKKKPNESGEYSLDMGFVDDMKDKVTPGKFLVSFLREKKSVEQINIEVEADGTFLINGEKRGKF